tara:strand:- start:9402 stop:9587 length:186 start_codon:yes stop_codon:yes gene_type:complete
MNLNQTVGLGCCGIEISGGETKQVPLEVRKQKLKLKKCSSTFSRYSMYLREGILINLCGGR